MQLGTDPASAAGAVAPHSIALPLDDAGNLQVPIYLERETAEAHPVRCAEPQRGRVVEARFVGSDRQTNLTVLCIAPPADAPTTRPTPTVRFREAQQVNDRPAEGSLLVYISPGDGSGRLALWNGASQEFGLVYQTDGAFAGIARYGQFLSGRACRLIADQLIEHGSVRRATLGVLVSELRHDDPLRRQLPVLGSHTAMRVEQVVPGSAAEKAGLRPGDLLLTLAGEAVSDIPSLAASIAARSGRTELQILRDGQVREVVVDLQPK
jgi:S1-C subfamily serine protease